MSKIGWISDIAKQYPTFSKIVLNTDALAPTLWIQDQNGWQNIADTTTVRALSSMVMVDMDDEEAAAFTSAGLIVHREAIDGVGQVTVRHVRGSSSRTVIVTITPISTEADLTRWDLDATVTAALIAPGAGLILVGGTTKPATELSRALFAYITSEFPHVSAAVVGPEPVARPIAQTPWLWLTTDPRSGVTHVEDVADALVGLAEIVLLDVGGDSEAVDAALRLTDAGALVIANVPGQGAQGVLERWEAAGTNRQERWVATLAALRAVFAIEEMEGHLEQLLITEYLVGDQTSRSTLAREGPNGTASLLSNRAGAQSREEQFKRLRARGAIK